MNQQEIDTLRALMEYEAHRTEPPAAFPVLLVHAASGAINAFYNTCSHRGAPIVTEAAGKRPRLVCKYHG